MLCRLGKIHGVEISRRREDHFPGAVQSKRYRCSGITMNDERSNDQTSDSTAHYTQWRPEQHDEAIAKTKTNQAALVRECDQDVAMTIKVALEPAADAR